MKTTTSVVLVLALSLSGCSFTGASKTSFSQTDAIAKVNHVFGTTFPEEPGKRIGNIREGGPNPRKLIPAILQTKVEKNYTNEYIVTFMEQWSAKDFHGMTAKKATLEHDWSYKVTPSSTTLLSSGGDFPPQLVR